jgi:CRISPR-associated protein Cas6
MNPVIDLAFRVSGDSLPLDHGYSLYSSLSRISPDLHEAEWLGIHPINGIPTSRNTLGLTQRSRLRLRLPADHIPKFIGLAGKRLSLASRSGQYSFTIGVPEIHSLLPTANLFSHYVTIKLSEIEKTDQSPTREMFSVAIRAQLQGLNMQGDVWIDDTRDTHGRECSRRVIHIRDRAVVCYSVYIRNLSEEDSLRLQALGIGGRRRMGCGIFTPCKATLPDNQ